MLAKSTLAARWGGGGGKPGGGKLSMSIMPTKHPKSNTLNSLKGIRGLAFRCFVGMQPFKHIVSAGFRRPGQAADAHDAPFHGG